LPDLFFNPVRNIFFTPFLVKTKLYNTVILGQHGDIKRVVFGWQKCKKVFAAKQNIVANIGKVGTAVNALKILVCFGLFVGVIAVAVSVGTVGIGYQVNVPVNFGKNVHRGAFGQIGGAIYWRVW
jgi:hypothetical protein